MKGINIQNLSAKAIMSLFNIKGPNSFTNQDVQTDKTMIDVRMKELEDEYTIMWEQNRVLKQEKYEDTENIK